VIARAAIAPGLRFEVQEPAPEPSPLRSDVAAFIGPTRRGPIGVPMRVEGLREYERLFGKLDRKLDTSYAIRGYFENGGEVAWIMRLAGASWMTSKATWAPTGLPELAGFELEVTAASPGEWSKDARVAITYRGRTNVGQATIDVDVTTSDEREEHRALPVATWAAQVNARSQLIRVTLRALAAPPVAGASRAFLVEKLTLLSSGHDELPGAQPHLDALAAIDELPEVALIAMPELHRAVGAAAGSILREAMERAEAQRDRLVLVDLPRRAPSRRWAAGDVLEWIREPDTLGRGDLDITDSVRTFRAAALYHPWLRVLDPLGGSAQPTRDIPPSGHVAGVISRLDRERGAHATPANSPLTGIIDLREEYEDDEHAVLNAQGVCLLRCVPSLGFSIWGGRTLDRHERFLAHRRLVHRLVRGIRRVAEPLVFETNGPALWFAFVRAITALLLEAFRAGALAGERPDEAFEVVCDETTNPQEEIDQGRCVCLITIAPAVPMEVITIRVALSRDGALEVLS
jgi:hypothetical protein